MNRSGFGVHIVAVALVVLTYGMVRAAEPFPFDQELVLDAEPIRPGKRMPILTVEPNGNAQIDLWCRSVSARMEISESAIKIEAPPLPEGLPDVQGAGQCTPERIKADEDMLASIVQVTDWRWENDAIVLTGPATMKFRPATN
jgi:hypothetical protein